MSHPFQNGDEKAFEEGEVAVIGAFVGVEGLRGVNLGIAVCGHFCHRTLRACIAAIASSAVAYDSVLTVHRPVLV